ncbi:MAG TPA: pirin family protein [Rhodocyclaceae bacterium]|jgi:redox-sensitive bicupin YhaK (pirin superfamily)|nr:pirin family protein [Rhodocyclaceae bacterium]
MQRLPARNSILGEGMLIRRALPHKERRLIGAWCFLDHAGPVDISNGDGVRVGPHPHIGLQTFTWMIEGEILHRDSLGYAQIIRPGQVNLMTAGRGISHSEETPAQHSRNVQLAQLWIALPDAKRHIEPAFEHYPDLPRFAMGDFNATLLVGETSGYVSPVRVHSPLVAIDLVTQASATDTLPLQADFEHGVLVLEGSADVEVAGETQTLEAGTLLYLAPGHTILNIKSSSACRLLIIGGKPFEENILLWWNFVGRTREEIAVATETWNSHTAFGKVEGYPGEAIPAPAVPMEIKGSL